MQDFAASDTEDLRERYQLGKDAQDWRVQWAKDDVNANFSSDNLQPIAYRPFDNRWTFYTGNSRGFHCRPRSEVMRHMTKSNLAFVIGRQGQVVGSMPWNVGLSADAINDFNLFYRGGGLAFPFKLYPEEGSLDQSIRVNFDAKLYAQICKAARLTGPLAAPDGTDAFRNATGDARPDEVKVFDYIYGVLHSPQYRETYAELLKIDFPRIPFPASPESFRSISEKGEELRRLHLMEPAAIGDTPFPFLGEAPDGGGSIVEKPRYEGPETAEDANPEMTGKVWINKGQYFDKVPRRAWEFYIGGYQPAQKWLKDRKDRDLSFDDIRHYQRIIKILTETHRIMDEIEMPVAGERNVPFH